MPGPDLLVTDDNENLSAVLLVAHFRAEPFLQWLDRPTDLVDAGPGLDETKIASFDQQVTVEASKSDDVWVNVVDQADLEQGGRSVWKRGTGIVKILD